MDKSDKPTVEGRMNEVVGTPIFVFQRAGIKPGLHNSIWRVAECKDAMKTYIYWNNSKQWHGEILLKVKANSILEADEMLKNKTGYDAVKCVWIGCTVE